MNRLVCLTALAALTAAAQSQLSLKEAISTALEKHPAVAAVKAGELEAGERLRQARSGYLPRVSYAESYQRSNNPVFVFGSLLTQRQFTAANFDVARLNTPDFLNNFQSQITVDQTIYDAGQTRHASSAVTLAHKVAGEDRRRTDLNVILNVVRAYSGTLLAEEAVKLAGESVKSAEADLKRAEAVRSAGMATDADVLSIRVHLAGVREQLIRAENDRAVSRAALNDTLGVPLDTQFSLTTALTPSPEPKLALQEFEKEAAGARPELRQANLAAQIVAEQSASARASYYPQVYLRGMFEADRQQLVRRGGANWFLGVTMKWNLFNGYADKSRVEEAAFAARRVAAEKQRAESGIRLEVRKAYLDLKATKERLEVAQAAVVMAEESHRIIQNRYENGLTTVTELLRSETALDAARMRRLAAVHDQRVATATLLAAAAALNKDSEL